VKELVKMNNWHSSQAIIAALQKTLSKRYRSYWEKIPIEDMQWFLDFRSPFLVPEELKKVMIKPPCIPSIYIYLNWIKRLHREHGPNTIDEMINI